MTTTAIPDHVRPELVVDFNYLDQPVTPDPHGEWKKLHDGPDVFWTPHNGGHWILTRAADLKAAVEDHGLFSSAQTSIPRSPYAVAPIGFDPPDHTRLKAMGVPAFTPQAIGELEGEIRSLAEALIDGFIARGTCEFVGDFALHLPIVTFMKLAGLPLTDREMLLDIVEALVRDPDLAKRAAAGEALHDYSVRVVRERMAGAAGDDLVGRICHGYRDLAASQDEAVAYVFLLLAAGLDTVSAGMGFMLRFLADNPGHRRQLIEEPGLIRNAIEEMLRRFGVSLPARVVTRDATFAGVELRQGDAVLLPYTLAGLDERAFADPLSVDFRRKDAAHSLVFGGGIHRCIGSFLARLELRVALETWLARIPEFRVDPARPPVGVASVVNSLQALHLQWDLA